MIEESQNIEHKENWRDEYLKWICGFANAQGGCVYIGVDDDRQVATTGFTTIKWLIIASRLHHRWFKVQGLGLKYFTTNH